MQAFFCALHIDIKKRVDSLCNLLKQNLHDFGYSSQYMKESMLLKYWLITAIKNQNLTNSSTNFQLDKVPLINNL